MDPARRIKSGVGVQFDWASVTSRVDVAGVIPHKQCLFHRLDNRPDHRNPFVDNLVSVANRAEAQRPGGNHVGHIRTVWKRINNTRSNKHRASPNGKGSIGDEIGSFAPEGAHSIVDQVNVTHQRLLPKPVKQVDAGDAIGKTRTVMAHGNTLRAALAGVDDDDPTAKPSKIVRGGQTGGPTADYETVARPVLEDWVVVTDNRDVKLWTPPSEVWEYSRNHAGPLAVSRTRLGHLAMCSGSIPAGVTLAAADWILLFDATDNVTVAPHHRVPPCLGDIDRTGSSFSCCPTLVSSISARSKNRFQSRQASGRSS